MGNAEPAVGSLGSLLPGLQPLLSLPFHRLQGTYVMWPVS